MGLIGIAVFACIFHAYYHEYKDTPEDKKPRKKLTYLIVFVVGISLIFVLNHYLKDTEYVNNLRESFRTFEKGEYQDDNITPIIIESQDF